MAVTVTGGPAAGGLAYRAALDAVAGNATSIAIPSWTRKVTITFVDSGCSAGDGKILRGSHSQSDGASMSTHAFPVSAGSAYELTLIPGLARHSDGCTIYLSGSAGGYAHLDLEL